MTEEKSVDMGLHGETIAARGGWSRALGTVPSTPPIYQTTAFDLEGIEQLDAIIAGQQRGYTYTRDGNPNQDAFAADVAQLEGAERGMVAASGMGGLSAVLLGMLRSGDHVLAADMLYGRTGQLLTEMQQRFGIAVTLVDPQRPEDWKRAVTPKTRLAIVESVSNPLTEVCDVAALVAAVGSVPLLVDNTFATPSLYRPIADGAALVWHSGSKYLNGHGDVMLGVVVGRRELVKKASSALSMFGLNSNPFECWMASRGLRTLGLRMKRVSETAFEIAGKLQGHAAVSRVFYPGLETQMSHSLAKRMLTNGFGGMLSFELHTGEEGVKRLFRLLAEAIPFSPTLADARTTVSYPAGTSHRFLPEAQRLAHGIGPGLVRLSIGLEDSRDLWREIEGALSPL